MKTNMTTGNPLKLILLFSLPIFIGIIFQQLYNIVDTTIIGRNLGDNSLAAIGATAAIYGLLIGFSSGIQNGFGVVLSRYFGKNDEDKMKKTVFLIFVLTIIFSIFITVVGLSIITPFLRLLKTPDEIIDLTAGYLRIILIGYIALMFYNMYAAILRAVGNSIAPLVFLAISALVNVVLDIIFVKYLHLGINGAAWATVISFVVALIASAIYTKKSNPSLFVSFKNKNKDIDLVKELLTNGLAMALMLAIVSIGTIVLQFSINDMGTELIAGHTTGRRIDEILMMPLTTLSMATATFASQNFGAGKIDRVRKGVRIAIIADIIWTIIALGIALCFGKQIIGFVSGSENSIVLDNAFKYLIFNVPFFPILCFLLVMRSCLQGVNRKKAPIIASIMEMSLKIIATFIITAYLGYIGVCIIEPIIWTVCSVIVIIGYIRFIKLSKKIETVSE